VSSRNGIKNNKIKMNKGKEGKEAIKEAEINKHNRERNKQRIKYTKEKEKVIQTRRKITIHVFTRL
jgi:hypothetical protein